MTKVSAIMSMSLTKNISYLFMIKIIAILKQKWYQYTNNIANPEVSMEAGIIIMKSIKCIPKP